MAEVRLTARQGPLQRLSAAFAWAEARLTGLMILAVLALLLGNVVSRAFGRPLIWTDELAVYLMVVGAFAGGLAWYRETSASGGDAAG